MTSAISNESEILCISRKEVSDLLTPRACLERCLATFAWVGRDLIDQSNPVNLYVHDRSGPEPPFGYGVIQAFPALIRPLHRAAIKWLSSYRRNPRRGLPSITALNILTDIETGMPLAIMDGSTITAMRTGGHAAVGAKFLARHDSSSLAMVGCGNEARTHLRLLNELFDLSEVKAFDISSDQRNGFVRDAALWTDARVIPVATVEAAVSTADVVCVVTTAPEPVVFAEWIPPGAHVCAATGFRDVDRECAKRFEKWVVGWYGRDLEWIEGVEVGKIGGLRPGDLSRRDIYADLATEILPGLKPGRDEYEERTIMTHMGMPALDGAVTALVYERALEEGVGTRIQFG